MIKRIFEKHPNLAEFARFCVVGLSATAVDFGLYALLTRSFGIYFLWANMTSVLAAMFENFLVNKYWTFQNKQGGREFGKQMAKFFVISGLSYGLNQLIVYLLVAHTNYFAYHEGARRDLLAKVIAIAIVLFINYFGNKYWTFQPKKEDSVET